MPTVTINPSLFGTTWHLDAAGLSWADLIAAAGNDAGVGTWGYGSYITSHSSADTWTTLFRDIILFNPTSVLPSSTIALSATLRLYAHSGKLDTGNFAPTMNIYQSAPAADNTIVAGDFDSLGSTSYSDVITYANWTVSAYNNFLLNVAGLAALNVAIAAADKFRIGTRNANYDVAAVSPTWVASKSCAMYHRNASPNYCQLTITYAPRGGIEQII